jgi:hypothetical protein
LLAAAITFAVLSLAFSIRQRKEEARNPFLKIVNVDEQTTDPEVWGANWPREYESYLRTVDTTRTLYGGSEAMPEQRLDRDPWLRRMYSGYAFSIDFRDRRGHAYMLADSRRPSASRRSRRAGRASTVTRRWRRRGDGSGRRRSTCPSSTTDFQWGRGDEGLRADVRHELHAGARRAGAHAGQAGAILAASPGALVSADDAAGPRRPHGRRPLRRVHRLPCPEKPAAPRDAAGLRARHPGIGKGKEPVPAPAEHRALANGITQGSL